MGQEDKSFATIIIKVNQPQLINEPYLMGGKSHHWTLCEILTTYPDMSKMFTSLDPFKYLLFFKNELSVLTF